jgi:hypothetical protein
VTPQHGPRRLHERHPFLLSLLVLLAVVIPGFIRVEQIASDAHRAADHANTALTQVKVEQEQLATTQAQLRALLDCIQKWAAATTDRTSALAEAANAKSDALDRLLRDAFTGAAQARLAADGRAYIHASDAYNQALRQHPIPRPPQLHCVLYLPPTPPPVKPEPSPTRPRRAAPTPTPASTVTVVRAVPVPGVTVTVTETVFRTVTVPPGRTRSHGP